MIQSLNFEIINAPKGAFCVILKVVLLLKVSDQISYFRDPDYYNVADSFGTLSLMEPT